MASESGSYSVSVSDERIPKYKGRACSFIAVPMGRKEMEAGGGSKGTSSILYVCHYRERNLFWSLLNTGYRATHNPSVPRRHLLEADANISLSKRNFSSVDSQSVVEFRNQKLSCLCSAVFVTFCFFTPLRKDGWFHLTVRVKGQTIERDFVARYREADLDVLRRHCKVNLTVSS